MRAALGLVVLGACSAPVKKPAAPATAAPIHLVAAERDPGGGSRLVVVDEDGERAAELVPAALTIARDGSAVFSPDGAWIAFVSSRGRTVEHTSVWVVAAQLDATPVRITDDKGDDLTPAWSPDGHAIVFASTRGGGVQLYRIAIANGRAAGAPEQLTHVKGAALSPTVAPDGRIAFASIEPDAGGTETSLIAVRAADGAVTFLTKGPADTTPSWSPDGKTLAFSAPIDRGGLRCESGTVVPRVDADILTVDADGGDRHVVLDVDDTSEASPVWSHDGRWLFATSLKRKAPCQKDAGKPLLSSIVYGDTRAPTPRVVRMLREPAAPVSRFAIAVAPVALDDRALAAGPEYLPTLEQILVHALDKQAEPGAP